MERDIDRILGPTGLLAQRLPGYEIRPQQLEMAHTVARAFETKTRALIEAGTGTGKTLAYLVPAVLSGKRTLVSTATKNLQEQIFYKDVPLLREIGLDVPVAHLKGRSNYLCRLKFDEFRRLPLFRSTAESRYQDRVLSWADTTQTGDRAELTDLPEDFATWGDLSTTPEACLGRTCPQFDQCFVTKSRRQAAEAAVIIVNHHLFFADLAVREDANAEVLPEVQACVFDEAHHLEESASSFFGRSMSLYRYRDFAFDLARALRAVPKVQNVLTEAASQGEQRLAELFATLQRRISVTERAELDIALSQEASVREGMASCDAAMALMERHLGDAGSLGDMGPAFARRVGEMRADLSFLLGPRDSAWVYFAELRGRRDALQLQASPIDLSDVFLRLLYPKHSTTLFTSATLTVGGQFHYFRSRIALGPAEPVSELVLESAFDYMEQAVLYVPADIPEPSDPDFVGKVAPTIQTLLELTSGRAFVLCTSYKNMRALHERLKPLLPYPVLLQGERPRSALLEDFRKQASVLFATSSFWEGVDVPGDKLSLVIMDKLPFASPVDPVVKARIEYVREQGGEPFRDYQLPQAAIALKQGFGRLIRHKTDVGIVTVLDRRLLEKSYGRLFLETLPRARRTRDFEVLRQWWAKKGR